MDKVSLVINSKEGCSFHLMTNKMMFDQFDEDSKSNLNSRAFYVAETTNLVKKLFLHLKYAKCKQNLVVKVKLNI